MSRSAEVLIYRSDTSTAKKAWFNCLFSIIFGSAFFLILPFMNKAQELSKEPIVKVQKIPPITKVEKKKIQKPKPPEEVKKVLEPIQAPVKIQKMSLPKLQLDLSPVSFKTDMQLTSMETDFDFSLEDLVAIDNSPDLQLHLYHQWITHKPLQKLKWINPLEERVLCSQNTQLEQKDVV